MSTEMTAAMWTKDMSTFQVQEIIGKYEEFEREQVRKSPIRLAFSGKTNIYTASDGYSPPEGECIVPVEYFFDGYICWATGGIVKDIKHRSLLSKDPLPPIETMEGYIPPKPGDDGTGWKFQMGFVAKARDEDLAYIFSTSSISGVGAVRQLLREITSKASEAENYRPVILFTSDSFMAKGHKAYRPVFHVVDWV